MGDIETSATAAIKIKLADTDLLSQYINERDKEPIWDGFIYAYKNKYKKNDDLIGRAPVQVKGKTVKRFSKKNPKYKVSITNLEKYRNDGGVLYFVVHIDVDKNKKIYYAALQPFLINQYLRIAQSKKLISINLKELPDRPNDFENIVINFIEESQKQSILKTGKNWTIEEVEKLLGRDNMRMNCHFTCIGYDRNDPFSYLKNNELYLHIQNPDGTLSFPVQHLEGAESVITERSINVYSNGRKYYDLVQVERHKDETLTFYFGKSFKYICERDKHTLKYALTGNLDERLQDLRFIIDVFDTKCLTVNGLDLPISPTQKEIRKLMTCRNKRSAAMTEKNLIRVYTGATSEKRIDIIIKNYTKFIGIVDGYTDGLRYMIECEKESSHRQSAGDLGVRVQTGGMTSDPTARKAINNVITREALINCDFSGNVLDGVDQAEVYIRDAYILRDMRKDYNLFNSQLGILGTEKETFTKYLLKEKTISDIAEDQGITYESARQQMQKIKVRMKKQVKRFMDGQPGGIA